MAIARPATKTKISTSEWGWPVTDEINRLTDTTKAFGFIRRSAVNTAVPASTVQKIPLAIVAKESGAAFTSNNTDHTCQKAGPYMMTGVVAGGGVVLPQDFFVGIAVNGGMMCRALSYPNNAYPFTTLTTVGLTYLNVGDVVNLVAYNAGASITLGSNSAPTLTDPIMPALSVWRLTQP